MDNFDLKKYLAEGKLLKEEKYSGAIIRKGSSDKAKEDTKIVRQALKKAGIKFTNRGEFGMNFKDADLAQIKKVIAGEKVGEFVVSRDVNEGVIKENEEQGYTLYDTKVEYDNGKTGYMFQLVNSEDREENEIGFDQLFFDDEDNRLEMGVDFNSFDQGSYQEGEYTADEAMKLYNDLAEGKLLNESAPGYDTRKQGEALPTLESVKAAYEAKNDIKEDASKAKELSDRVLTVASEGIKDLNGTELMEFRALIAQAFDMKDEA